MLDLNIVIVNWKAKGDIEKCLKSLFWDLEDSGLKFVVQVVDNSENCDGIKEMLEENFPEVKYLDSGGNIGFGRAQNMALKKQEAKYYLPLNPDIYFKNKGSIEKLIKKLEFEPKKGLVAPKLLNPDGSVQLSCCRFPGFLDQIARRMNWDKKFKFFQKRVDEYLMRDFNHQESVPVDWVMGSFMLLRGEVARELGFFDERFFMYFEDCDWCRRIWEKGWQVYYQADVEVFHGHRRDSATHNPFKSIFNNPIARTHLKSWLKYFLKWGFKKKRFGK